MSQQYRDEHAIVLGADALPPSACRVPHAVWINRPAPRGWTAVVRGAFAAGILLGLAGIVVVAARARM
ncbi:MAG TPA: hypothetical protein VKC64_03205 [Burkholderiales bacterium]|nr:hypothetical protein [Burkholderiales bacterium]